MRYHIPENIISIAHRGYSSKYEGNTWKAFKNVGKKGFHMIEVDIQLCKTGEIIIYHDIFIKNEKISNLTLQEVKKKKKSIITLKDFFNYFDSTKHYIYLDLKGNGKLAYHLFCFFKTYTIDTTNLIVCSFNKKHLDFLRKKMPELQLGLITENILTIDILQHLTYDIDYLIVHWTMLDDETITYCHEKGISVFTYTMNGNNPYNHIQNFNIDGIISDYRLFNSPNGYGISYI